MKATANRPQPKAGRQVDQPVGLGKTLRGTVVSNSMDKAAVVEVARYMKHPKVGKYIRKKKRFTVQDVDNVAQVGDEVTIEETRPVSKNIRFKILKAQGSQDS